MMMVTTNNTISNQITIDQSDVERLNSRKASEEMPDTHEKNNTGSHLPSLVKKKYTRDELQEKISKYSAKLKAYERKRAESVTKEKGKATLDNSLKVHQKKVSIYHQKVLDQMLMIMDQYKAKGFVYGMVTETHKPISGSSDSLRAWWKNEIMFDNSCPIQTDILYREQNSLFSNVIQEDNTNYNNKSTTELLMELSDPMLGSILSLIMQQCDPPQRKYPFEKGISPPWWSQINISTNEGPPPYRKPHDLRKKWKVAVIVGIIKLISPNFLKLYRIVKQSRYLQSRMSAKERKFWNLALAAEARKYCQEHPNVHVDEVMAFLYSSGGSSVSEVAPKADKQDGIMCKNKAPCIIGTAPKPQVAMSGSFAPQYPPIWGFSYNPTTLSANAPMGFQPNDTIGYLGASSSRFQGHYVQPISYPPFGGTPSTDGRGTQDQIMKH